jgi:hypothetical protein
MCDDNDFRILNHGEIRGRHKEQSNTRDWH